MFNDAVAIILFQTMTKFIDQPDKEFNATTLKEIAENFFSLSFMSILIGSSFGFLTAIITKKCRFIASSAIVETTVFFLFALQSYYLAENFDYSGIVAILFASIIQSQYSWYNLSPQGKHVTSVTFDTLGFIAQAIVFTYIGLSSSRYIKYEPISWKFVLAEFFIVIIGRFIGVYMAYGICSLFPGSATNRLSFRQLTFISYAALIRGAISFGLIQSVEDDALDDKAVLESSTLYLIITTTVAFGTFCSKV